MKLDKLVINNFMPYKGSHTVEFPQHETQNVMLLFGDNMRGKTSFLNSIRWGLYGIAVGRHLRTIPWHNLVNRNAASEGDWTMSVSLIFSHLGASYEINRIIQKHDNVVRPGADADFTEIVGMKKDGKPVIADRIVFEINQIIPQEISRFFLFDGEFLQEYENLVIEKSVQGEKIKGHIEQALGVPALINARDEMGKLLKDARSEQQREAQKNQILRGHAQSLKSLQERLASLESDLSGLKKQEETYQEEIAELDDYLRNTETFLRKQLDIERLTQERKDLDRQIQNYEDNTLELLKSAWQDVLFRSIQPIANECREKLKVQQTASQESLRLKVKLDERQKALEENKPCPTCGQNLSVQSRQHLEDEIQRLKTQLREQNFDQKTMNDLSKRLEDLENIRSDGDGEVSRIIRNQSLVTRDTVELLRVNSELDDLEKEIADHDTKEMMRRRNKKVRWEKNLILVQRNIQERESEITKNQGKQQHISQVITKSHSGRGLRSSRRVTLYEQLQAVFSQGIARLRDQLREQVERHASGAFKKLIAEHTYSGLQINKNYGLSILDQKGEVLNERSAGAEQIVALSLIDGLNRTARKTGPIIMDTPLSRLDPKHRTNVLRYLPDMADQVILLVHEGEIDPKTDIQQIAERIGARYKLQRVSATESRIEKVIS